MTPVDTLRPPSRLDASAAAYKDWLHLNVFDHATGTIGLVNASLHGSPEDARSRACGAALLHMAGGDWIGNIEVLGIADANVGRSSIALEQVAVAVDGERVLASARMPRDGLMLDVTATAASSELDLELRLPLGAGWISWFAVPVLTVPGSASLEGRELDLSGATAYHDHNWGRWHWGDDLGWEWGCFASASGRAFVLSRTTDRAHRRTSRPLLVAQDRARRAVFGGRAVELGFDGLLEAEPRRLPGSFAALHGDRAAPRLPGRLHVRADDGADHLELEFRASACAQLIAADPAERGYGFIHQLVGEFSALSRVRGVEREETGLAVVEYVD